MKRVLPWLAIVVVLAGTACLLRSQGRLWWCYPQYHPTGSARDAALIRRASPRMAFRNFQEAIVL
jgi:hypothetical protein